MPKQCRTLSFHAAKRMRQLLQQGLILMFNSHFDSMVACPEVNF